jgi:hypothetical protein
MYDIYGSDGISLLSSASHKDLPQNKENDDLGDSDGGSGNHNGSVTPLAYEDVKRLYEKLHRR